MYYSGYEPVDFLNGEGARCTLWVSGCEHQCRGCFNQKTWSFSYGKLFTYEIMERIIEDLRNPYISGLSILGGEPLHPKNKDIVLYICSRVRREFGNTKNIMVWTGYFFSEVSEDIKSVIDILVDGKYDDTKPTKKRFRGSDNQVLYYKENNVWKMENNYE